MIRNVIFDLDDTLCTCGPYYNEKKEQFAVIASQRTGIEESVCRGVLEGIDSACTKALHGFNRQRFPKSFAGASAALDIMAGRKIDEKEVEMAYLLGESVFYEPYPLFEGVDNTLTNLSQKYVLFLCTLGDIDIQMSKIEKNNLYRFFDKDRIYIVSKKDSSAYEKIVNDHQLDKRTTVVVGDSIQRDIMAAQEAGLGAIWVSEGQNEIWLRDVVTRPKIIKKVALELESVLDLYAPPIPSNMPQNVLF